jgi:NAD(P)H-nitrite reductase large subunit
MEKYVIIGNSIGATGVIEGIREHDKQSSITVISGENHPAYCRPLISYYLEGKTDLDRIIYRPDTFYEDNGCEVIYAEAVSFDPADKTVALSDGTKVPYSKLCLAMGSSPFIPSFPGIETADKVYSFTRLDDALELEQAVVPGSRVLIIGAGFIGLKCAEGLKGLTGGLAGITVCDLAPHAMNAILDEDASLILERHLEANGVRLMLGDSADRFEGNRACMKSGTVIDFDVLVIAVGTRPNIGLAKDAGCETGRGIIVDTGLRTSIPDVYAVGDCCESYDVTLGEKGVLAILPNASMQGRIAGANMAGQDSQFETGIKMNSIGFFGMHIMSAGTYYTPESGGDEVYTELDSGSCKKLFSKDGYLTGFILVEKIYRAGIYTNLIRNRIPLDSVDFEALKKEPLLFPFGEQYRRTKLGGVV